MVTESFLYYSKLQTGFADPHLHFREDENAMADVVMLYKPLFYSVVSKYYFLGQETIFNVYIDCIYDCLKRFDPTKGKQTFGNYLKNAFLQGCLTEITKNNCDKRKANIGTYNIDDIFNENTAFQSDDDEEKLNDLINTIEGRYKK